MIRIDITDTDGKYVNSVYNNDRGMNEDRLHEQLIEYHKTWNSTTPNGFPYKSFYPDFADFLVRWANWIPKPQSVFHFQST